MFFKKKKTPFYTPGVEIPLKQADKWRYLDMTTRFHLKRASGRVLVLEFVFLACFCVIIARLFQLTVRDYQGRYFAPIDMETHLFQRFNILDRNGIILATSLPTRDLSIDPLLVKGDPAEIANNITNALDQVDYRDVYNAVTSSAGFKYIKRNITPKEQNAINWLGYYFLSETYGEKRVYPQAQLVSHLLGGVDIDNVGIAGIEKAYDQQLQDHDVQLTIDVSVQEMVRNALKSGIEKYQARGGLAIVMDVNTSEVLASVSLPDYNPNVPATKMGDERFNQATLGTYEFGSIFKLFNTALGLDSQTITVDSSFDATKPFKLPGRGSRPITDYMGQARWLTVPEILILSSNIGSAQIGLAIGAEKQREFFRQLGFYEKLPIALPERGTPNGLNTKERWNETESSRLAYGYGLAITPLHLVAGIASLINGGLYYPPTFIKGDNSDRTAIRMISEKTSQIMRHLMWAVVAWELPEDSPVSMYAVGGKTGSKQILKNGEYVEGKLRTSFIGAFPMNDPKYLVFVSIEDPQKLKETWMYNTAGWNAKPVGLNIIGEIAPYLGVEPIESWDQPAYIQQSIDKVKEWKKVHR